MSARQEVNEHVSRDAHKSSELHVFKLAVGDQRTDHALRTAEDISGLRSRGDDWDIVIRLIQLVGLSEQVSLCDIEYARDVGSKFRPRTLVAALD